MLKRRLLALSGLGLKSTAQAAPSLEELAQGYDSLAAQVGELDEAEDASAIAEALRIAVHLCGWAAVKLEAGADANRFIEAAQVNATLLRERLEEADAVTSATTEDLRVWAGHVEEVDGVASVVNLVAELARLRTPVFYSKGPTSKASTSHGGHAEDPATERTPVVKLMFALNGQPLVTPQAIRSGVQHDLKAEMAISAWPADAEYLQVEYFSTMAPDSYHLTQFTFQQVDGLQQAQQGHCTFRHAQTLLSEPAVLRVRARFGFRDARPPITALLVGHPELRLRALDASSFPTLSGYPTMDIQIPKIVQAARQSLPDLPPSDFEDFIKCLIYLARYAGMALQTGVFKGRKVRETQDFQQHLLQHLRMTDLASEVREGERSSGGILDLRYRNIVIELKVETTLTDRTKLRAAYLEQPSQYTAQGVPLSIACILDMTEKEHPPANIANNITLETPKLHGFNDTTPAYPSKVAVLVIDGNLKSPSDYS